MQAVLDAIETGNYKKGQLLPSINEMANANKTAKETIAKAYAGLRQQGFILSKAGKGFYVADTKAKTGLNIFVLFDTFYAFKETIYSALKAALPKNTRFHILFHHYNVRQFEEHIKDALGNYNFYVIMPHFNTDVSAIVNIIPRDKLLLLDRDIPSLSTGYAAAYQDFENDMLSNLQQALPLIKKYKNLHLQHVPVPIIRGFKKFCKKQNVHGLVMENLLEKNIQAGDAYLIFHDTDMVHFIKFCEKKKWKPSRDIGLISFDDTDLKEILLGGITVITTDFKQLGTTAGQLINEKRMEKIANPTMFIKRKTL